MLEGCGIGKEWASEHYGVQFRDWKVEGMFLQIELAFSADGHFVVRAFNVSVDYSVVL
jgi:hypothetical protein